MVNLIGKDCYTGSLLTYTAQRGSEMCSIRLDKAKRLMTRDLHVCKGVVFERFNVQFDHYLSVIRVFHSYSISVCLKVKLVSFLQTGQIGKLQCIKVSGIFSCLCVIWWNYIIVVEYALNTKSVSLFFLLLDIRFSRDTSQLGIQLLHHRGSNLVKQKLCLTGVVN